MERDSPVSSIINDDEGEDEELINENNINDHNDDDDDENGTNNKIVVQINQNKCRLCDNEAAADKMFNIFEDNPDGYQLIALIKENLSIVLYKTDPLSKYVCDKCVEQLELISNLKKQSKKTQDKYVEKLKTEGELTDKNILLFLGCTGSKLITDDNRYDDEEEEEEEEDELKDEATSTEDLTILCANCKTAILDASTVNGQIELANGELRKILRNSMRKNQIITDKVLRHRKIQPYFYQELDDSLCSSNLTDLTKNAGDDTSQDEENLPTDGESAEEEDDEERPTKRRKRDDESSSTRETTEENNEILQKINNFHQSSSNNSVYSEEEEMMSTTNMDFEEEEEIERIEDIKVKCEELFKTEPGDVLYEPLSLLQLSLNYFNSLHIDGFVAENYIKKSSECCCKICGEKFLNVKLLALHEPLHMDVDVEERIDNPSPWPKTKNFFNVRNKWLTKFDDNNCSEKEKEEEIVVQVQTEDREEDAHEEKKDDELILKEVTPEAEEEEEEEEEEEGDDNDDGDIFKKDEVVLVEMKPIVNGIYLGDYTKEERKTFYQCMRIGGQTKRFCPLCRYCFKDNWAIESHYFSFACHYTCRYCGMRFNKQRHRFDEHIKEHENRHDVISDKIYTASKLNNALPKVIQPDKVRKIIPGDPEKPREISLEDYSTPPLITKGGFDHRTKHNNSPSSSSLTQNNIKIKQEPIESSSSTSSANLNGSQNNNKTQNQAYFCRKCYKVFFKLDEFNAHSKNCDYNSANSIRMAGSPSSNNTKSANKVKQEVLPAEKIANGEKGRPVRNCAKDIGRYKDEIYIPRQVLNETVQERPQSFICHICGTPFPTIYSRNSHMRIHKGEVAASRESASNTKNSVQNQNNILKQRLQNYQMQKVAIQQQILRQKQLQRRAQQSNFNQQQYEEVRIKEEPVEPSFEPMVEIHEGHEDSSSSPSSSPSHQQNFPRELSSGEVSLTPIRVNKKPVATLNPSILKLVQNNPNISLLSKKSTKKSSAHQPRASTSNNSDQYNHRTQGGNIIKNAGGYQGPYAPINNNNDQSSNNYLTVSSNLMPSSMMMMNNEDINKSYKCSSCWEAFSNKSHLYFHKKNQCEGSRFPCPFCKKRFGTEAAYSSHIFYSHPE